MAQTCWVSALLLHVKVTKCRAAVTAVHWWLQAVGPLLELCRGAEGSSAAALAIVSTIIQRHLSPPVWLPLLQQACHLHHLHVLAWLSVQAHIL